jgi:Type II site-specific deoxyribonuclease
METDINRPQAVFEALLALTPSQIDLLSGVIQQFRLRHTFSCNEKSDLVTPVVLNALGDALRIHHAFSRQPLSKDRFEFALEWALNRAGIKAELVKNRTNRGHDITIEKVPVSLKTQADANIKNDTLHISKFMELGKGEWKLASLRDSFLKHMDAYERIFQFRCLVAGPKSYSYELVEIPKKLLIEAENAELVIQKKSRQTPKPGYGYVNDDEGKRKFALYFDGGTERKLQIKLIRKDLCIVHATWEFESTPFEKTISR